MIRIAYLDDHPATRAGLDAIFEQAPDLTPAGAAGAEHELWPLLHSTHPDVVLLDYHHPGSDGLAICRQIKSTPPAPQVIIYTTDAGAMMSIASILAGADAIVSKDSPERELLEAIRVVARGEHPHLPAPGAWARHAAVRLEPDDHAILAMRLAGTAACDVATTLGLSSSQLGARTAAMIGRLMRSRPLPAPGAIHAR